MPLTDEQKGKLATKLDKLLAKTSRPSNKIPGMYISWTDDKKTQYLNFKGVVNTETKQPVNEQSKFPIFSCTKAMTGLAALRLWEEGKVDLDAPASKYLPLIDSIGIVEKGTVDSKTGDFTTPPKKPTSPVTLRNLLNQTAGFSYAFLNKEYYYLMRRKNPEINAGNPSMELFTTEKSPLIQEPGSAFCYGTSMDFVGLVIQEVTGLTLGAYLKQILFDPVGMKDTSFGTDDTSNLFEVYLRTGSGQSIPVRDTVIGIHPKVHMGGQGAVSTVHDFLRFLRVFLNDGVSPDTGARILKKETVEYGSRNHLPEGMVVKFNLGEPPLEDGFSLLGMAVSKNCPTGRPDGSVYWSGLANLYYWVDYENKIAGFWVTEVLPFFDPKSYLGYCQMESAVYDVLAGEEDDDDDDDDDDDEEEEEESKAKL